MDSRERCSRWASSTAAANQLRGQPAHPSYGADADAKWILGLERARRTFWPAPLLGLPEAATLGINVSGLDRSCFIGPSYPEESKYFDASAWMFGPEEPTTAPRAPHRPSIVVHDTSFVESHTRPQDAVYAGAGATEHLHFKSLYGSVPRPSQVSRLDLLQAWRVRTGLVPSAPESCTRSCGARGGLLPLSVLERVVRDLLGMAAPDMHPRRVLAPLAMASRRLRGIAAPFIYEHVEIRNKQDREVYARAGAAKYVRRLTIYFDPYDTCNPHGALKDKKLCANPFATSECPPSGISYHFPRCSEVRLVAQCVSEELPPAQCSCLEFMLSQRVPPTVSRVILETDLAEVSARFAVQLMMREYFANFKVTLEIRTNRDEVVRNVERAVHSHISLWTGPVPLQTHLVLRGPTYGTDIVWDECTRETGVTRKIWQEKPTKPAGHPNQGKCRVRPTQDENEVLGVQEAMAEISRRNASSAQKITTQAPLRRSSRQKGKRSSKAQPVLEMPPPKPKFTSRLASTAQYPLAPSEGVPSAHLAGQTTHLGRPISERMPLARQTPAWHAGKLAAEIPSVVERMIEELEEDPDHQGSRPCCPRRDYSVVGVQNPIARAELNAFVGTYYARRYAARCRMAKLARMRELQKGKAKSGPSKQDKDTPGGNGGVVQSAAEGPVRKRRRRG